MVICAFIAPNLLFREALSAVRALGRLVLENHKLGSKPEEGRAFAGYLLSHPPVFSLAAVGGLDRE
jgi:hypothetical protein